jgi:hypothetical protein
MSERRWDDGVLDALRDEGDPHADAVVAGYFADLRREDPGSLMHGLVRYRDLPPEELDPAVAGYLAEQPPWPAWAKPELVAEGEEFFARWGSHVFTALYAASLPTAYAAAKGVQVLHLTARLATDAKRRLNETAQFHLDVLQPGGLQPGRRGYDDVRHVRLMHAAVRWLILHDDRVSKTPEPTPGGLQWNPTTGLPINQEDLLETLLTFTQIVFEVFDRTGVRYTEDEAAAYLHTWCVVGYLIGIRPDLLPLDLDDAKVLMAASRRRNHERSAAGVEMTAALLDQASAVVPRGLRGLPASAVRFYVGDDTADILAVPAADWTLRLFKPLVRLTRLSSYAKAHERLRHSLSSRFGRAMLDLAVRAERGPDRPNFQIPTSLADRWSVKAGR